VFDAVAILRGCCPEQQFVCRDALTVLLKAGKNLDDDQLNTVSCGRGKTMLASLALLGVVLE
jgi:hypothetical protein